MNTLYNITAILYPGSQDPNSITGLGNILVHDSPEALLYRVGDLLS